MAFISLSHHILNLFFFTGEEGKGVNILSTTCYICSLQPLYILLYFLLLLFLRDTIRSFQLLHYLFSSFSTMIQTFMLHPPPPWYPFPSLPPHWCNNNNNFFCRTYTHLCSYKTIWPLNYVRTLFLSLLHEVNNQSAHHTTAAEHDWLGSGCDDNMVSSWYSNLYFQCFVFGQSFF